ncbi:helix-turn-helix domain-containing protein [Marinicella sp. W31]|uniref:helix-turn-helix domain-containing protein n=1 Tax=Marinicella sp. W31 TaxID=3023713 RepID=UPI003757A613
MTYIYTIGAAQGVVLAFALFRKKVNVSSNRILAVWLLILAFDLLARSIYLHNKNSVFLPTFIIAVFLPFLHGSFFYIYVRTLIHKQALRWRDLIHATGFIVMAGLNIPWIINPWENGPRTFGYYEFSLFSYSVAYVIAGLMLIYRYRKTLVQQQSNTEGIDLLWLNIMAYSQIVIWMIGLTQWLTPIPGYNQWHIYIAVSIWIIVMGYLALSQQPIKTLQKIKSSPEDNDDRFPQVQARLEQLMSEHQLYLQPALNIAQLAKASGYPEYLISQVINRVYQVPFREYINQLRVQSAQEILSASDEKRSILDIAYDCGFTSKSTFNSAFKRILNETPSAYRSRIQADA